jgi:hypothetical protein
VLHFYSVLHVAQSLKRGCIFSKSIEIHGKSRTARDDESFGCCGGLAALPLNLCERAYFSLFCVWELTGYGF